MASSIENFERALHALTITPVEDIDDEFIKRVRGAFNRLRDYRAFVRQLEIVDEAETYEAARARRNSR